MTAVKRRTVVVYGRLAMEEARLEAARSGQQGAQIMTFEQIAARLAGGFCRPIDGDSLRLAITVDPIGYIRRRSRYANLSHSTPPPYFQRFQ